MIVDDHPVVREGLAALISVDSTLKVCCNAGDITTAIEMANEHHPDVAIVDISLQNENGLDLVRRLSSNHGSLRVLVLSMYDDSIYGERAFAAGAMGYLNKHVAGRLITTAIHRVNEGQLYLSDDLTQKLLTQKLTDTASAEPGATSTLTNRELDVFRMIGMGNSTADIAAQLHLSAKTVEAHRQNIKRKLGLHKSAELSRAAAHWVLENG